MAKQKLYNFKSDDETIKKMKKKSDKHTKGNLSAWIKKSATEYEPPVEEKEKPASK